jgi:hypothetical protein
MAVNAMPLIAGDRFTADGYNLGKPIYAWKTSSESVTSSIVDQLDDELLLPVDPFSVYLVLACYSVTSSTTGDIRLGYSVPTGAQGRRHNVGLAAAATSTSGLMRISVHGWPTAVTYGATTTAVSIIEEGVLYTQDQGGLLQAQWAQNVSDATATTVATNSFLMARQVLA